jgi:hypothetical protein
LPFFETKNPFLKEKTKWYISVPKREEKEKKRIRSSESGQTLYVLYGRAPSNSDSL